VLNAGGDDWTRRSISVGRLRRILSDLPEALHVVVHPVTGNLSILNGDLGKGGTYSIDGWIDLAGERYESQCELGETI
jgi:hypothetical protein